MISIPYYETSYFIFHNFSAHAIKIDGVIYPTAEHAFHAQKFESEELRSRIVACPSPIAAFTLGKELKPQHRSDWNEVKVDVLTNIIRQKALQNPDVKEALLRTGVEEIVEVNPKDSFWGSGADGKGWNYTGKILMKIREELKGTVSP
ncbi:TPA: DUF1768 domain-containing protein [Candidatus Saccharibacteria bacterium]|nr:MAG: hypothetical protein UW38_C0001G0326 [Candidatus Saccharibacteria bacterium GW2011_GWC2_44_17]OGL33197.1 MAG: hypothetical protein A3E20_01145 [Candidatus Saccharibacteria bacterium RIFCSPHIGHO2_12_FULL_47_16]HBH77603.1 DUF1768 domain-containing protein [Candidatus Saccharibacteria bacterium]